MGDIIIEGDSQWPMLITTFVVGLSAAVIGAVTIFLLETWKQVLQGQAAAQIVRIEMADNGMKCRGAVSGLFKNGVLRDEAWQSLRIHLVPLLPDLILAEIASGYAAMFLSKQAIERLAEAPSAEDRLMLMQVAHTLDRDVAWMGDLAQHSRLRMFVNALLGKPRLIFRAIQPVQGSEADDAAKEIRQLGSIADRARAHRR